MCSSTSHLLLELHDDLNGHVEDAQFGLRLVRLQVRHAHAAQFLERFVDVANSDPGCATFAPHPASRCVAAFQQQEQQKQQQQHRQAVRVGSGRVRGARNRSKGGPGTESKTERDREVEGAGPGTWGVQGGAYRE